MLIIYSDWPHEDAQTGSYSIEAGDLDTILIIYSFWPDEPVQTTYSIIGGTLV